MRYEDQHGEKYFLVLYSLFFSISISSFDLHPYLAEWGHNNQVVNVITDISTHQLISRFSTNSLVAQSYISYIEH